jgi:hypothetical protein
VLASQALRDFRCNPLRAQGFSSFGKGSIATIFLLEGTSKNLQLLLLRARRKLLSYFMA